jgi:hypothetical protein
MKRLNKFIYKFSIVLIAAFIVLPIAGYATGIELATSEYKHNYQIIRLFGLPLAILLTMFGRIKGEETAGKTGWKVGYTILISFIVFILCGAMFFDMCGWSIRQTLYEVKDDPDTNIVLREYGCGAYDSGKPEEKIVRIKKINRYLIQITAIDTSKIEKIYIPVNNK